MVNYGKMNFSQACEAYKEMTLEELHAEYQNMQELHITHPKPYRALHKNMKKYGEKIPFFDRHPDAGLILYALFGLVIVIVAIVLAILVITKKGI